MLVLLVVSSKDCDGSPSFGQAERNAATDPTITTSHDSHPTGQVKERGHLHSIFLVSSFFVAESLLLKPALSEARGDALKGRHHG